MIIKNAKVAAPPGRPVWFKGLGGLLPILVSATFYSCSSTPSLPLSASSRIPAGRGTVKVRSDANRNTTLEIAVDHLAPPERVSEDAKIYVVWLKPTGEVAHPQNLGAFSVDKNLSGNLETVTPFQAFDLFITAEPSAATLQPSGERIFWAQVNHGKVG